MKIHFTLINVLCISLSSCATQDDINRLSRRISALENKTDVIYSNQSSLQNDLNKLHLESEKELDNNREVLRHLEKNIYSAKRKTDLFKVENIEGNIIITPPGEFIYISSLLSISHK